MDINFLLNIIAFSEENQTTDPLWMSIMNIIIGIIFVGLAALFIWIYFDKKHEWETSKPEYNKKTSGSFKGYWLQYRSAIVAFMTVLFILIAIGFIAMGLLGFVPKGLDEGGSV